MADQERNVRSIASEVTTLIAFVSFSIIYLNLIWTAGLLKLAMDEWPTFRAMIFATAHAPLVLSIYVVGEFIVDFFRDVFGGAGRRERFNLWGIGGTLLQLGVFLGTIIFVLALSFLVAHQSHSYLVEVGPSVAKSFAEVLSRF